MDNFHFSYASESFKTQYPLYIKKKKKKTGCILQSNN